MPRPLAVSSLLVACLLPACFATARLPEVRGAALGVPERGAFPHDALDAVLKAHVDDQGRVDYRALREDRDALVRYLDVVARVSPRSDPELFPAEADALAYWINAYNAYVLFAVTERPDMASVDENKEDFFYFTEYRLGGESLSLYAIENDVVRETFDEPRIHFALNCASGGCPELPAEAFTPAQLDAQLTRESRDFCADPEKVRVEGGVMKISQIFEWYAEDFETTGGPVVFCRSQGAELPEDAPIEYIPYDWSLNAQGAFRSAAQ